MKVLLRSLCLLLLIPVAAFAQKPGQVIDQVAAVVGDNIIMQSEIEIEFEQMKKNMENLNDSVKCDVLKQKLVEKVMLSKAQLDSVVIPEERVDSELEKRIRYFARQFGGEKNMEEFYGKSISEIKADNREKIKQSMQVQEVQGKALKDVKASPTDIKKYFNELESRDSLPFYSAEVEVAQLVIKPKVTEEAKHIAYEKVVDLRQRIIDGDNFNTLAMLYSDDKGSAVNGGELGFFTRGAMVPEFEAASFRLKPDSISKVIETKYGYHVLRLIDRKGDNINVRHILIRPQIFKSDIAIARQKMDSITGLVKIDTLKFEDAVKKYSDDLESRGNGGFVTSETTGSISIPVDEIDQELYYRIEKLEPGQMTEPELITLPGPDREQAWRVLYLKSESSPHRANMKDDYLKFQGLAMQQKQQRTMESFIYKAKKNLYIHVNAPYNECPSIRAFLNK